MARLHEYQGKALLSDHGIAVPRGGAVRSPEEARQLAQKINGPVVMKIQAWTTGRAAIGGVRFADDPNDAAAITGELLQMKVGHFPVREVLIEEKIAIRNELFVSLFIDDTARAPVILLSLEGGSGIEDRAANVARIPVDVAAGVDQAHLSKTISASSIDPSHHAALADAVQAVYTTARATEARSVEINPLVITEDGRIMAADCRMTIDDYAVFRHPELGIEIARELDHPPSELERIAYRIEQSDHRGTFYFAELPYGEHPGEKLIGFHGAGGGGSMMSMDAVTQEGFTIANFCDTSGNPSAAKVYAAARIILAQPGITGYFGSGSGVASQEQFWSAYGLAKAFNEMQLNIPAVIRLGGNSEDRAVEILEDACRDLPGTVEGYRKDDTPASCAARFATLVAAREESAPPMRRHVPSFVGAATSYSFPLARGRVWIDHARCDDVATGLVVRESDNLLKEERGKPVLAVSEQDVAGKDSELIACEIECLRAGRPVVFVDLAIEGLDEE